MADDHTLMVEAIRSMMESRFDIAGVAEDGRALVNAAQRLKPDVILLDISMPVLNGIEAARQIRKALPNTKLVFVTMHEDPTFVSEALRAGGSGYVLKRSAPQELVRAVEEALRGRTYVTPLVARALTDFRRQHFGPAEPFGRLTPRQVEVLHLVAEGRSAKEIAAALHISLKTVEFHKSGIMRALGIHNTAELVRYAIRHGIVVEGAS